MKESTLERETRLKNEKQVDLRVSLWVVRNKNNIRIGFLRAISLKVVSILVNNVVNWLELAIVGRVDAWSNSEVVLCWEDS